MAGGFNLQKNSSYKSFKKKVRNVYPMEIRSPFVPQYLGGSFGWRGGDWRTARAIALKKSGYKSEVTGFNSNFDTLTVDHIYPYRIGGTNKQENLRVTNLQDNPAVDNVKGFDKPKDIRKRIF